jgi:hypothetical protein
MKENHLLKSIEKTFAECLKIAEAKNHDYANNENPYKNFENSTLIGIPPEQAILVRMSDKFARLGNLIKIDHIRGVGSESINDTIMDLINYSAILKGYLEYMIENE